MNVTHHLCLSVAVWLLSLAAMLSLVLEVSVLAEAKTLNVANNGVNSATCGDKDHPCRSIGKAIENASPGDKIVVGPGRYTWESEPGSSLCSFHCVILVNKPGLTIESRDGAAATVIDATGHDLDVVRIEANNVVFGKPHKGFTLTGTGMAFFSGLVIPDGTSGVKVGGNLAIRNSLNGFAFTGSGHVLTGNVANANGSTGFAFSGSGHVLSGNLASANGGTGFAFDGSGHVLSGNIASANHYDGFAFSGSHVLTGNTAVGNQAFGIHIGDSGGTDNAMITKNNIFGNNAKNFGGFTNCGLLNQSKDPIAAPNNFWGVTTGPSATEPADNVCDDPNLPGSSTTVTSFATKEFKGKSQSVPFLEESTQLAPAAFGGKTLFVANNGLDTNINTCVDKNQPCRTIGEAIENAHPGDTIVVGPGHYTWESEPGPSLCNFKCVILVNKPGLTIVSRDGAGSTVLDATGHDVNVVRIEASNVIFGKPHKGFTITGTGINFSGLVIVDGTNEVKVAGNLATANGNNGFRVNGSGHQFTGNIASANSSNGFDIGGSGHLFISNLAIASRFSTGFAIGGSGHMLTGNVSSANANESGFGYGFLLFGSGHVIIGNLAVANGAIGFAFGGSGHQLNGNSALGNTSFGFAVDPDANAILTKNNIFGNAVQVGSPYTNCGLLNQAKQSIAAPNNFWGVADGPGTLASPKPEPADNVCDNTTGYPGSSTNFSPFATKEFKVKTTAFLDETDLVVPADSEERESLQAQSLTPIQFLKEMQTKQGLLFRATAKVSALRLEVTDLSGRTIYDSGFVQGKNLSWTRVNTQNKRIASGVYLYRLTARDRDGNEIRSELRKLIILK